MQLPAMSTIAYISDSKHGMGESVNRSFAYPSSFLGHFSSPLDF